ncbi:hypothetical protein JHS31_003314 [Salmonella enterica]|nr:hypothetical protein [Salmonella enterica]
MPIISGTLKDGAGQPIAGCTIQLKAINTTSAVIRTTTARVGVTAGVYRIEAQPARYEVTLAVEDYPPQKVGTIDIYADSPDGTLNDFLTATKAEYLTPDVMNQFKLLAQQSRDAAEAAKAASQGISTIKDAAEKAASNAALSENNAAVSARAARTSEINAAGSVTRAAVSAAAALVSQNAAKTSEDAASASAIKASVSEVNAYYSAAAALTSQKAAKMSEDVAKASQVASATSADSASASAMSAQGSAINSTQAATDAIAAKNEAVRHVTGFDEYVSRQVAVIAQSADSATTKANANVAAATDISRNSAILAINQKQAEATGAIQATVGVAVTSADNAKKSETAARTSEGNADSSALRAETAQAAALYHAEAIQTQSGNIALSAADSEKNRQAADLSARTAAVSAQNAANSERNARNSEVAAAQSATTATAAAKDAVASAVPAAVEQVKTEIAGNVTRAETAATNAEASNAGAQQALEQARQIAKTPGPQGLPGLPGKDGAPGQDGKSAWEIWKDNQPAGADTSMTAYLSSMKGSGGDLPELTGVGSYILGVTNERANAEDLPWLDGFGGYVDGAYIRPGAVLEYGNAIIDDDRIPDLPGTWQAMGYCSDITHQLTLFRRIR